MTAGWQRPSAQCPPRELTLQEVGDRQPRHRAHAGLLLVHFRVIRLLAREAKHAADHVGVPGRPVRVTDLLPGLALLHLHVAFRHRGAPAEGGEDGSDPDVLHLDVQVLGRGRHRRTQVTFLAHPWRSDCRRARSERPPPPGPTEHFAGEHSIKPRLQSIMRARGYGCRDWRGGKKTWRVSAASPSSYKETWKAEGSSPSCRGLKTRAEERMCFLNFHVLY